MKVTMKPPMAGPMTGATSAGVVDMAMALTRSSFLVERSRTRLPTGVISAAARACSTLAPTNSCKLRLSAHSTEATAKAAIAPAKTDRAPSRSATQVDSGRNAAITRM